ncbi:hypothetical protein [Nonomuraea fuscirosea]|uniref:hypothetical protein n=1 Tax=Nonomuraea fuscirosea TaxID=1291556 RepID=UPI0033FBFDC2
MRLSATEAILSGPMDMVVFRESNDFFAEGAVLSSGGSTICCASPAWADVAE